MFFHFGTDLGTWPFFEKGGRRLDLEMSQMDIASAFLKEAMPSDMDCSFFN